MPKGFACGRKGHSAATGWDSTPQQNLAGHWFIPRVCRNCHCPFVEFIPMQDISAIVTAKGESILMPEGQK